MYQGTQLGAVGQWTAKNPLGIIALFISLIYGMSALLLGASIGKLTPINQTVLVWFIAIFPFAVLAIFAWLVIKHHWKLYAPRDFRSDEGYLSSWKNAAPSELGSKLLEEALVGTGDTEEAEGSDSGLDASSPPNGMEAAESDVSQRASTSDRVVDNYLVEGLVFQELQREFSGGVIRQVDVSLPGEPKGVLVDGVIQAQGAVIPVEIKIVRSPGGLDLLRTAERLAQKFIFAHEITPEASNPFRLILVFVFDTSATSKVRQRALHLKETLKYPVDVRIMDKQQLLTKFGLAGSTSKS